MAAPNYKEQRRWSDHFIPQIKRIVGPQLMSVTPDEIDCSQATDLYIFTARDMRIAARVRRNEYLKWKYQFTIRSKLDSGVPTELSKIVNGWGDWMFYAFSDEAEKQFALWWLIDLHALRAALIRDRGSLKYGDKPNGDGTHFKWFDLRSFPAHPPIIVAGSDHLPAFESQAA